MERGECRRTGGQVLTLFHLWSSATNHLDTISSTSNADARYDCPLESSVESLCVNMSCACVVSVFVGDWQRVCVLTARCALCCFIRCTRIMRVAALAGAVTAVSSHECTCYQISSLAPCSWYSLHTVRPTTDLF